MFEQISIFDFLAYKEFNPLEELALRGTGFENGIKRVKDYFLNNHSLKDKSRFLKDEYGLGGFGSPTKKPCYIFEADTFRGFVRYKYYDKNMEIHDKTVTFEQMAKVIQDMIENGKYKERD